VRIRYIAFAAVSTGTHGFRATFFGIFVEIWRNTDVPAASSLGWCRLRQCIMPPSTLSHIKPSVPQSKFVRFLQRLVC
jgi:hypothetical protein